jgi:hypothetical protein
MFSGKVTFPTSPDEDAFPNIAPHYCAAICGLMLGSRQFVDLEAVSNSMSADNATRLCFGLDFHLDMYKTLHQPHHCPGGNDDN